MVNNYMYIKELALKRTMILHRKNQKMYLAAEIIIDNIDLFSFIHYLNNYFTML